MTLDGPAGSQALGICLFVHMGLRLQVGTTTLAFYVSARNSVLLSLLFSALKNVWHVQYPERPEEGMGAPGTGVEEVVLSFHYWSVKNVGY